MDNYTFVWRSRSGELMARWFTRVDDMREFAKAVIQNGCIAQYFRFNENGEIGNRMPISQLRNSDFN